MNGIQIYQGDTLNISVDINADTTVVLTGFTSVFLIDFLTGTTSITGSTITDDTTTFTIPSETNDVEPYVYIYEVYIYDGNQKYTIINDSYTVLPSI